MKMRKYIAGAFFTLTLLPVSTFASNEYYPKNIQIVQSEKADSIAEPAFCGELYNKEYDVFIRLDVYKNNITIPGQEIFGEVSGYIKSRRDSRVWIIMSAEIDKKKGIATFEIINDYGSEDLVATLAYDKASDSFTLHQKQGSTIKFAKNGKWQKLPASLSFKKSKTLGN